MSRSKLESFLKIINISLFALGLAAVVFIFTSEIFGDYAIYVFLGVLALLGGCGVALNYAVHTYLFAAMRLTEEVRLIMTANSGHRIKTEGPAVMRQLAQAINAFADRFQTVLADEEVKIRQARDDLEEEKYRLVALMSELNEGVLICNIEGQILLYNQRAKHMLSHTPGGRPVNGAGGYIGLGRSIFGLIDRSSITHALEELYYRSEKQSANPVSQFMTTAANGQLIRSRTTLVLDQHKAVSGFILTVEDITEQSQASTRRDILLKSLTEGIRASLANIRAAIETIEDYPHMEPARLEQLKKVIHEEALSLSLTLEETVTEHSEDLKAGWQLEEILSGDLLWAIQRRFEDKLHVQTKIEAQEENLWLKVDSYTVVQAVTFLMRQAQTNFGTQEVLFRLKKTGRLAALDLIWPGIPADMNTLWSWQNKALITEGEGTSLTLREVADRHGGEVWCQADRDTNTTYFRLLLPTTQPKPPRHIQALPESRPEYYDFDLFHQAGQKPELDQRSLTALTYTIFDTETTGLNPTQGDEIISISAVRIVNGRLLRQEIFDQLVDPQRPLPSASITIHGILPQMVQGQPTIEQVLPPFWRFTEGTILVGHNAAFDMRLLQLKETQTGIKFTNPVLDTLLLSAVIHPNQESHSLEAIAQRLGINIIGRHTSLGDAMLTGEIFLKFIPLLAERGILTLKDAREAAEKTFYARLRY
ncbi:MAG: exonuclease domain-containing protein [Anaerolineae bacterium]